MIRQAAGACPAGTKAKRPGRWGGALVRAGLGRRSVVAVTVTTVVPSFIAEVAAIIASLVAEVAAVIVPFFAEIAPVIPAFLAELGAAVLFAVTRRVFAVVPVIADEIDAFAAGLITAAVPAPMPGMAGRNAQVERRAAHRYALDHHRLREKQRRLGEAADIDTPVETGLADTDRDLGGSGGAEDGGAEGESQKQTFHFVFLMG